MLTHGIYELNFAHNPASAAKYLEKAIKLQPDSRRVKSMLARAYFETEIIMMRQMVWHYI